MQPTPTPIESAASGSRDYLTFPLNDPADRHRIERVIAVARLFVSVAIIGTAARVGALNQGGLPLAPFLFYVGFSLLVLAVLSWRRTMPARLPLVMQLVDIALAAVVPWSHGLNGSLTLVLILPLLAAGYRQGLRQVLITAVFIDVLIGAQWLFANAPTGILIGRAGETFDINGLVTRTMFVANVAVIVGYLANNEQRRRTEAAAISHVVAQARPGAEFHGMVTAVLTSIRDVFAARTTLLVLQDVKTARLFRWEVGASSTDEPPTATELPAAARGDYLFAAPGNAWHAVARRLSRRGAFDVVAIDAEGRRLQAVDFVPPAAFMAAHPCHRVLGVALTLGKKWTGWVFVIDPALGLRREIITRFAQRLVSHTSRVIYGYYLVHSVRTRAQATERSRIARELHDGMTQSLLGLEMEIVALQRRAIAEAPQISADLARVQKLLRREVISMRETMEGIRAGNNPSGNIVEELAEMVDRFRRYTGIYASFVAAQPSISMSGHMRRQIALILHEALVNLRKHTRASRVSVRTEVVDGRFHLSIEDDGGGFPFAGRHTLSELDARRQGPRMIGERVRMIGGDMTVESKPGLGASIEISFPPSPAHE